MRRGAGVGRVQPAEPGYIAGQFDDALVVDVVEHRMGVSGLRGNRAWKRSWRPLSVALYMVRKGGNTVQPFPMAARIEACSAAAVLVFWDSGVRRRAAPSAR